MIDDSGLMIACAGLFVAGLVKGATGVGYATFALPVLTNVVGLRPAMALVIAPTLAANMNVAFAAGHFRETARRLAPLYAAMIPGVAAGAAVLAVIDQGSAAMVLGGAMVLYALFALMQPRLALSEAAARRLRLPVGFANGFLTGLTGSQVIPLVPYVMALQMSTARTLQAINIGVLILSSLLGLFLILTQAVDPLLLAVSLGAMLPALAGSEIGTGLQSLIGGQTARVLVLSVVGLMGLRMLAC